LTRRTISRAVMAHRVPSNAVYVVSAIRASEIQRCSSSSQIACGF